MGSDFRSDLVPFKKAVVDITKGTILRTYYIRPDKLSKIIQSFKNLPVKRYINRIKHSSDIDRVLNTGDISSLKSIFPKGESKTWGPIVLRNQYASNIYSTNPGHYYSIRSSQLLTSFMITDSDIYVPSFKKDIAGSVHDYEFVKGNYSTEIKDQKRKSGKYKIKDASDAVELNLPSEYNEFLKDLNFVGTPEGIDKDIIGKTMRQSYKYRLNRIKDSRISGDRLSRFLNFMFPRDIKFSKIISRLVTRDFRDNNMFVHNLTLLPELYEKGEFSELLISSVIHDINSLKIEGDTTSVNANWTLHKYLLLSQLSPKRFKDVISSYPFDKYNYITSNYYSGKKKFTDIFNDTTLLEEEKSSTLLFAPKSIFMNQFNSILNSLCSTEIPLGNISWAIDTLSCRGDVNSSYVMNILKHINEKRSENIFGMNSILKEVVAFQMFNISPTWMYYIFLILVGKMYNIKYIPYDSIQLIGGMPYSSFVVNKITKDSEVIMSKPLKEYIDKNKMSESGMMDLYLPMRNNAFLEDNAYFMRIPPVQVLMDTPSKDGSYLPLKVKTSSIIPFEYNNSTYYICIDLLHNAIGIE